MIDEAIRNGTAYGFMILGLIVIFAPLIAERFRMPGLLGLLIGGALIGPNVLGLMEDYALIESIGEIGILYLIFLAGLQLDVESFFLNRKISIGFGLITSIIPMALGIYVTLELGFEPKAAILIGSFWASFTLIAYPVIKQYGLTKNRAGAATIGASAITDTISLLILALIAGSETGDQSGVGLVLSIGVGLALLGVWCLIALPWLTRWFFTTLGRGRILRFMLVLVGLVSSAVVAEMLGIEPLLGAFFAGLGLNRILPNESVLMEHVDFFGNALFIPAFLVSVGLLFDPAVMVIPSTIWLAIWLTAALVIGKYAAAWLSGKMFRLSSAESGMMFTVSVAQAAATLAATIIGLELGLYGDEVVNAVMVVIAVSLVITSIGTPKYAALIEKPVDEERGLGAAVLVPTRGSGTDLTPRLRVAGLIAEANGGMVLPVVVAVGGAENDLAEARSRVETIDNSLHGLGLDGDTRIRFDRAVAEGISRAALENDASLVVLGWPGTNRVSSSLVESVADEVSRLVECPVAVAAMVDEPFDRVLLGITRKDLKASRVEDLQTAVSIAVAVSSQSELVFGPVDRDQLIEAGIELPKNAEHHAGEESALTWMEGLSKAHDLLVAVSRGRAFGSPASHVHDLGLSVVAVAASKAPAWVTSSPTQRRSMVRL